jgi:transposase
MGKKTRQIYERSFKERAVKMSYERSNIKAFSEELGVSVELLYRWRNEYGSYGCSSFQGHGVERLSDEGKRVKDLEKELRRSQMELEILKKAIAIFSQADR